MTRLAPAVAVVGPPNSGKSTLLNHLDQALLASERQLRSYILPGNPDGVGKYLRLSPELRVLLKDRAKGFWDATTADTFARWIETARACLDLVIVDLGGKRTLENRQIIGRCTHSILVARDDEEPRVIVAWQDYCRDLAPVAVLRSMVRSGIAASSSEVAGKALLGSFRADEPHSANESVLAPLVERLLDLPHPIREGVSYVELDLRRPWEIEDLTELGGRRGEIEALAANARPVRLGGARAPIWAYAAALHRALDRDSEARVSVFDPKVTAGFVGIPSLDAAPAAPAWAPDLVGIRWRERPGLGVELDFRFSSLDRLLPPGTESALAGAPVPRDAPPPGPIVVYGRGPIWLHLAYSRWLRSQFGDGRMIGVWDAGTKRAVFTAGSGTPLSLDWPPLD